MKIETKYNIGDKVQYQYYNAYEQWVDKVGRIEAIDIHCGEKYHGELYRITGESRAILLSWIIGLAEDEER